MRFVWDGDKNERLKNERGISFGKIVESIEQDRILDIVENRSANYSYQRGFVVRIHRKTWFVPFVKLTDETTKLITAYPSPWAHKRYQKQSWFKKDWKQRL